MDLVSQGKVETCNQGCSIPICHGRRFKGKEKSGYSLLGACHLPAHSRPMRSDGWASERNRFASPLICLDRCADLPSFALGRGGANSALPFAHVKDAEEGIHRGRARLCIEDGHGIERCTSRVVDIHTLRAGGELCGRRYEAEPWEGPQWSPPKATACRDGASTPAAESMGVKGVRGIVARYHGRGASSCPWPLCDVTRSRRME